MSFLNKLKNIFFGPEPSFYKELIKNGAVVIDVRTNEEFDAGHLQGSLNIPIKALKKKAGELKGKEVVLVCKSGVRAATAKGILNSQRITAHNAGPWTFLND
jgi:phage shock protein E